MPCSIITAAANHLAVSLVVGRRPDLFQVAKQSIEHSDLAGRYRLARTVLALALAHMTPGAYKGVLKQHGEGHRDSQEHNLAWLYFARQRYHAHARAIQNRLAYTLVRRLDRG